MSIDIQIDPVYIQRKSCTYPEEHAMLWFMASLFAIVYRKAIKAVMRNIHSGVHDHVQVNRVALLSRVRGVSGDVLVAPGSLMESLPVI